MYLHGFYAYVLLSAEIPMHFIYRSQAELFCLQQESNVKQKQMSAVLNIVPSGVVIFNEENKCEFKNKNATEMLNLD